MHHAEAGRMLAERWGLPSDVAVIAGRHHDGSEGVELNALRIVHIACSLADVLGFDVVKPLKPPTAEAVLAGLPPRARQRLLQSPEELLKRIQERISEFSSDKAEIQPEEALAMLATAATAREAEASPEVDSTETSQEPTPPANLPEPVPIESRTNWTKAIVIGVVIGLAAAAALAYWMLR